MPGGSNCSGFLPPIGLETMNLNKQINILLVDDQSQNLLALEAILESPDYRLVRAHSGKEALKQLLTEEFAVILLDVQMPEMDGFETARLIKQREQSRHVPIIFLTALSEDEEALFKGYSVGAVDYVFKPFKPIILKSKVAVFVELYRKSRQLWQEQAARAGAEAMQSDLSFLVNAGSLLASSLDYPKTLERVARLAVPKFADWCVVDLIENEGLRRLAVAHADPAKEAMAKEYQRRYPADPDAPAGAANVLRTGEPEIYREITDEMLHAAALDPPHLELLRGLGLKSVIIVPLKVWDRTLGVITFVSAESGRVYGEIDLFMAEELARRAALAIDNARLFQEAEREIAERSRAERRLGAQYAVARVLAESVTLNDAAPKLIQAICESLDWEVGGIWRVEPAARLLRCVEVWHRPALGLSEFDEVSREKTFTPGEGLPGRIWACEGAVWIPDVAQEVNFPRGTIAAKAGLHGAFGFPIRRGTEILGVLEFFSHDVREPDADLLQLMTSIGSQIGQFIERKQAEGAMQESEARKAAILESALDCIITMDDQGRIIEFNPAAERTFGYRREAVIGKEMAALIIPFALREKHRQGLRRYLSTEEGPIVGKRIELTAVRADGREFPVELAVVRIPFEGRPMFTGYLRDITQRREAEEALKRKTIEAEESSRLKSQFVSNISHELRTPINAIIGYSALLLDEAYGPVGPEQKSPLEGVVRNAQDLLNLVNDVLDLSKIEAGKLSVHPESFSLSPVLEEVVAGLKPFLDQKTLRVTLDRTDHVPPIKSDRGKVKQIFTNLIANAIKFTPKGTITIKERNRPGKKGVEIAVEDTGIGIRPEELPKLFSAFHQIDADLTREYGGVGLGLRIVKDLIDLLRGEIRVESEHQKGSTFTVFLPYIFERRIKARPLTEPPERLK